MTEENLKESKMNKFMKKYGFWIGLGLAIFVIGITIF